MTNPLFLTNRKKTLSQFWTYIPDLNKLMQKRDSFFLYNDASRAHWFSYHRLLDIKHMVIVKYFFKENLLLPHRLLFPISSKGSFTCTFPQTGQHITQPLIDHLWATGSNGTYPKLQIHLPCRLDQMIPTFTGECSTTWATSRALDTDGIQPYNIAYKE